MSASDDVKAALSSPEYESAFSKAMLGREAEWTDAERDAVRQVRRSTGASGPGYLMPWRSDPTRTVDE